MKRLTVISLCLLLLVSCGGSKGTLSMDDLQKSNEDLVRRVKSLEDQLLETQKKQIHQDQAIQAMHEQLRDMENVVNKIQLTPAR
jgi:TolA-binding protein